MSHHCISLDCVEILQYLKRNPFSLKRISHHCKDCTSLIAKRFCNTLGIILPYPNPKGSPSPLQRLHTSWLRRESKPVLEPFSQRPRSMGQCQDQNTSISPLCLLLSGHIFTLKKSSLVLAFEVKLNLFGLHSSLALCLGWHLLVEQAKAWYQKYNSI